MFAFPKGLGRPYVFAHRGAMTEAPENTLPSFLAAERLGCDGIELDVHLSADGVAVVTHDPWIVPGRRQVVVAADGVRSEVRFAPEALASGGLSLDLRWDEHGGRLRVAHRAQSLPVVLVGRTPWEELRRIPQGYDADGRGIPMPRLEEVLEAIAPTTGVDIEIKRAPVGFADFEYAGIVATVVEIVRRYHREDSVLVSSFDHRLMRDLVRQAPDIGALLNYSARIVDPASLARTVPTTFVSIDDVGEDEIREYHEAGLQVITSGFWTAEDYRNNARWGVEGVVVDDMRIVTPVDADRGQGAAVPPA